MFLSTSILNHFTVCKSNTTGTFRPFSTSKLTVASPQNERHVFPYTPTKALPRVTSKVRLLRQKLFNGITLRDARRGKKSRRFFSLALAKVAYFASTFWRLRFFAMRKVKRPTLTVRASTYRAYSQTPFLVNSVPHYKTDKKTKWNDTPRITRHQLWRLFRMRMERFMFKAMGCRVYVWFHNLWRTLSSDIAGFMGFETRQLARLAKKGTRFTIRENHARVFMKSAWLAVTMLGGVSVFMQMLSKMVQTFRSHWAVVMYSLRLLDSCRCFFWYKTLMQYRMTVRGKFGGQMRAGQKTFQHGVLRLNAYSVDLDYYRIRPITKYGTFSLRFWLQFRDLRIARIIKVTNDFDPSFFPDTTADFGNVKQDKRVNITQTKSKTNNYTKTKINTNLKSNKSNQRITTKHSRNEKTKK